jgi:spermidine/putrescine transport system ATP-binding protein
MSLLNFENVIKKYGDLVAVHDCSFEIADGEFISILGPSGSGKSTILRMIAGFEEPTNGDIQIENRDLIDVPPFERDINMVFQDLALFPHLTVFENIAYGLKNEGVPADEREERIENMLDMVQLSEYSDRKPQELSGGEQQRVALVRALVKEPAMVLFDEPLASLDRQLRQHMQIELQRIQEKTDTTFLYVTHDQEVAMAVSDRMILLRDGEIEQIGTAQELYEEPASQFVADFLGDVNTISATVHSVNDGDLIFKTEEGEMEFPIERTTANESADLTARDSVYICVRPHSITLSNDESSAFTILGHVRNRIYKGNEVRYMLRTDIGPLTVDMDTGQFQIGDTVHATWPKVEGHVFSDNGEQTDAATDQTPIAASEQ